MSEELTKHTLNLRKGDFDYLKGVYPKVGSSAVIRKLVSRHVDQLNRPVSSGETTEIKVELIK